MCFLSKIRSWSSRLKDRSEEPVQMQLVRECCPRISLGNGFFELFVSPASIHPLPKAPGTVPGYST